MPLQLHSFEWSDASRHAFALLKARPLRWLAWTLCTLVVVESLTFVPYVGFLLKLGLASLLFGQWMLAFADVDVGRAPDPRILLRAFAQPFAVQWAVIVAGVAPFVVSVGVLATVADGWTTMGFFFGHMTRGAAPGPVATFGFKVLMAALGAMLVFVPGFAVLTGVGGVAAIGAALRAVAINRRPVLLLFGVTVALEAAQIALTSAPLPVALTVSIVLLLAYLPWSIAIAYAGSIRALDDRPGGIPAGRESGRTVDRR